MSINCETSTSEYAIIVEDLKKFYGNARGLIGGFSCRIKKGENTVLLGNNGAGKTTLMNIITNIKFPDDGAVYINNVNSRIPESRSHLRYLPEDVSLPSKCNILDIIREYQALNGRIELFDVEALSEEFNCHDRLEQKFSSMSKGQKRLMFLALILSGKPDIVMLDEPMEGLDPMNIHKVRKRIKELCKSGTTVLQSTHRVHEAEQHGGNYMIIHNGEFVAEGKLSSIEEYCKISYADSTAAGFQPKDIILTYEDIVIVRKTSILETSLLKDMQSASSLVTLEDIYLCSVK